MKEITEILHSLGVDETRSAEELIPLVYEELRRLAAGRLAAERAGQTLQATALVHEAWLRLADADTERGWKSRGHFFGAAAEAMRRILVENARRKQCQKRGAGAERVDLDALELAMEGDDDRVLAVNEAVEKLACVDPRAAELVKLRFFAGLSGEETAAVLGVPVRTASRLWAYARAWLYRELSA
jgi:RNA polymerase sigma factor (TIGR02999 family)